MPAARQSRKPASRHLAEALAVKSHRDGGLACEEFCESHRLAHHLVLRDQTADHANAVAFLCIHHAARERQVDGTGETDDLAHDPGARGAGDARVDLRLTHGHARVANAEVAQERHLEGRAGRDAVQSRNDGLRQRTDAVVEALPLADPLLRTVGIERLGLVEVLPGPERAIARAG